MKIKGVIKMTVKAKEKLTCYSLIDLSFSCNTHLVIKTLSNKIYLYKSVICIDQSKCKKHISEVYYEIRSVINPRTRKVIAKRARPNQDLRLLF